MNPGKLPGVALLDPLYLINRSPDGNARILYLSMPS